MYKIIPENGIEVTKEWRDQQLPEPIRAFTEKWQVIADKEMEQYERKWPAKLVESRCTYKGVTYYFFPDTFGIPQDLMERLQPDMDKDMKAIKGVTETFHDGFLD